MAPTNNTHNQVSPPPVRSGRSRVLTLSTSEMAKGSGAAYHPVAADRSAQSQTKRFEHGRLADPRFAELACFLQRSKENRKYAQRKKGCGTDDKGPTHRRRFQASHAPVGNSAVACQPDGQIVSRRAALLTVRLLRESLSHAKIWKRRSPLRAHPSSILAEPELLRESMDDDPVRAAVCMLGGTVIDHNMQRPRSLGVH